MKRLLICLILLTFLFQQKSFAQYEKEKTAIQLLMQSQENAWNQGKINLFMNWILEQ